MRNIRVTFAGLLLMVGLFVLSRERAIAAESPVPNVGRDGRNVTVITIRPSATVDARVIRIGDVANITGGDAIFREQLKQLDLEDVLASGDSVTILPPQIEFRLRIAGIDVDRVSIRGRGVRVSAGATGSTPEPPVVTGTAATWRRRPAFAVSMADEHQTVADTAATTVTPRVMSPRRAVDFAAVSSDEGPLERAIVQAAKKCVLGKLPWPAENVDIRLAQPVSHDVRRVESVAGYECSAEQRSLGPAVGRVQVRVIAEGPRSPTFDVTVMLDVRHFDRVVLTTKAIERGHLIVAEDLYVDRQDVTDITDYCSSSSSLIGTTTKRPLRGLLPVRTNDFEAGVRTENAVLVKRREQVKMTAHVGPMNVSATGEALQEGRLGETIRLRNLDSNTSVRGRVVGHNEVEILF